MAVAVDARMVADAEVVRIVIYPNRKREKTPATDKAEAVFEYYDEIVTTYKLLDSTGAILTHSKESNEVGLSEAVNDITATQTAIGADLKKKVAADTLKLSGKDILSITSG